MSQPRPVFLAVADLHLQERAWHGRPSVRGDAIFAFRYIVSYALRHRLPILAAGDLIDKKKNEAALVSCVRRELSRLSTVASCEFYFVQGQHDWQNPPWFSAISPWPTHLAASLGHVFEIPGKESRVIRVGGLDWTPKEDLPGRLAAFENSRVDVLVMHQTCREFMGGRAELDWGDIPEARLLIVGDFHKQHTALDRFNRAGLPMLVLSPGSTAMQSIDEPERKSFFVVHDDFSVRSVEIPTRPVIRWPCLETEEELEQFCREFPQRDQEISAAWLGQGYERAGGFTLLPPLLDIPYRSALPGAYARILAAASPMDRVFPVEVVEPAPAVAEESTAETLDPSVALTEFVEAGSPEEQLAAQLIHSRDPVRLLRAVREKFLSGESPTTGDEHG